MKKKNGVTLIELIFAMILGSILVVVAGGMFIFLDDFNPMLNSGAQHSTTTISSREAMIVTVQMSKTLRFAKGNIATGATSKIAATIEGGHLLNLNSPTDTDTICYYRWDGANSLFFSAANSDVTDTLTERLLSSNVSFFSGTFDAVTNRYTLQIKFFDKNTTVPIETVITAIGGE